MLPNFFLIGAAKSGTSSFWSYLRSHPDVYMSEPKEPHYFAYLAAPELLGHLYPSRPSATESYLALFDAVTNERAIGDASTTNLAVAGSAEQIHAAVPDARIVVVLRDPVERAHSQFVHFLAAGAETTSDFAEAVFHEEERLRELPFTYGYMQFGRYAGQLEPYLRLFGRERVLVHLYEDFTRDPQQVLRDTFAFLGVDPTHPLSAKPVRENVGGVPRNRTAFEFLTARNRSGRVAKRILPAYFNRVMRDKLAPRLLYKPRVEPIVRARLIEEIRPEVERLQELIGRDLSAWLKA